ncbi:MAG: hypothetical protein KJ051_04040 [Thermoleophilia bacterium]|nr:hypothetical protein [Thermoleophilia bacterium]
MAKMKVTYALDEAVVRAARMHAARKDLRDSEVVEVALREYLGLTLLEELRAVAAAQPPISLEEVVAEQHAARAETGRAGRP